MKLVEFEVAFAAERKTEAFHISPVRLEPAPKDVLRGDSDSEVGAGNDDKGERVGEGV